MARTSFWDDPGTWIILSLTFNNNVETDTGYDLPDNCILYPWEMFLIVDTIDATETIEVGILSTETGGDADGFLNVAAISVAGYVKPYMTATDATSQNYISANTYGAYFSTGLDGGNAAGTAGVPVLAPHITDGIAKSISYTCSAGSDTFLGRLVFKLHTLPT